MAALKYWVWLATLPGLGTRTRLQLLEHFDSPEDIYYADEGELLLTPDITKAQAALLADKSLERTEQVLADCARDGQFILTMGDSLYPNRLHLRPADTAVRQGRAAHVRRRGGRHRGGHPLLHTLRRPRRLPAGL